jgi:hypothetical protein
MLTHNVGDDLARANALHEGQIRGLVVAMPCI